MAKAPRWLCAVMVAVVALTGPLALILTPAPASAQTSDDDRTNSLEPTGGDRAGAIALNFAYVPGKALMCGLGTVAGATFALISFGTGYRAARNLFLEGCGGDWILTGEHLTGKIPPRELPTNF